MTYDLNGHISQFNFVYTVSVALRIVSGPASLLKTFEPEANYSFAQIRWPFLP